ncbi:MAG: hypothetical protein IJ567_05685 [Lachnospiraceae bacterium]|nr:hypothetical protein [Lachnospiraceae bacterium]
MTEIENIRRKNRERCLTVTQGALPKGMIHLLDETGFFTAPAARKHHGAYIGGLYDHSEAVAMELADLTRALKLEWEREASPVIVGMLHDLCKTQEYVLVKDKESGTYKIEWNDQQILTGHGTVSVIIAQQLASNLSDFWLTDEEMLCIRYHMGAFTDAKEWEFYGRAIEEYPNVLYTHTADMIASKIRKL